MKEKAKFGTKIGLVAATVGSAIGLGNVWRFPSEAQSNGGAAFLLIYILCMVILGIPVMLAEFSIGRAGQSDSVGNFKKLTPGRKWWIVGAIGLIASYLILSYYMVVAGWTIEYLFESISGGLYHGFSNDTPNFFTEKINLYICSDFTPLTWTYIMLVMNLAVLLLGVQKGIEKISNIMMPLLFVLMVIFCIKSLSLPNAIEGVKFFIYPDLSKVSIDTVINALGQAFFSLSLGMGILVTYSAYYPKETKLTRTAVQVSTLDFFMAFLMGLIIFPAVKSFGIGESEGALEGTTLIFVTLPQIFANMSAPALWSSLFFLLLAVAAITSTISIAEVSVSFVCDRFKKSRTVACFIVILPLFITSALSSLSLGHHPNLQFLGLSLFDLLDTVATNILLPISAFFICIYVGWIVPKDFLRKELTNYDEFGSWAAPHVTVLIKYICPILILSIMIFKLYTM